jgi:hypothetical protein
LSKTGEFAGAAAVPGDKVEGANVVPAGKPGADAMETPTAGPPEEVEVEPPLPQAAKVAVINRTNNR